MKNKIFSLMALAMFGLSLMSVASNFEKEENTDCSVVYTVCDTAFPNDFNLFERCMVNNGCGGDEKLTHAPNP